MKFKSRALALLLALMMVVLSGCGESSKGNTVKPSANTNRNIITEDRSGTAENMLTVYCPYFYNRESSTDYRAFQQQVEAAVKELALEKYPDLEIAYYDPSGGDSTIDLPTAMERMSADIMVGKGPDVIISETDNDRIAGIDISKQAQAGLFADLSEILEREFFTNFHSGILASGEINGQQYILPLNYYLFSCVSSGDILSACGLSESDFAGDTEQDISALLKFMKGSSPRSILFAAETGFSPSTLLAALWPDPADLLSAMDTPLFEETMELLRLDREKNSGLWKDAQWITYPYDGKEITLLANAEELEMQAMLSGSVPHATGILKINNILYYGLAMEPMGGAKLLAIDNTAGGTTARVSNYAVIRASSSKQELAMDYIQAFYETTELHQKLFGQQFPSDIGRTERAIEKELSIVMSGGSSQFAALGELPWTEEWLIQKEEEIKDSTLSNYGYTMTPDSAPLDQPQSLQEDLLAYASRINGVFYSYLPYELVRDSFEPYLNGEASYSSCLSDAQFQLELYLSE